jgi:hypothetical protein
MFYIALRVKDRGVIRDINMIASMEELQDLLSKVRGVFLLLTFRSLCHIVHMYQVRDAEKQTEMVLSSSGEA